MNAETVLVVGAAGKLGRKIARAVQAKGFRPKLGVRDVQGAPADLKGLGDVVRADLTDPESLRMACDGVNIVISAVQGGPDVIVDGQTRLLEAAQATGVTRFVPSDFSLDLFALDEGENWNSDMRRTFDQRLIASGLGYTIFLNGGFMEAMLSPYIGMVDREAGTLSFWGDGATAIDMTSMDDVAAYLAEVIGDPATLNEVVRIAGDALTMPQIAAAFERATGQTLTLSSHGSIEEGYAQLEKLKAEHADIMRILPFMYQLPMMSGKAKLRHVANARYPGVTPTRLVDFLRSTAK